MGVHMSPDRCVQATGDVSGTGIAPPWRPRLPAVANAISSVTAISAPVTEPAGTRVRRIRSAVRAALPEFRSTIPLEWLVRAVFGGLSESVRRTLAGPPIRVDGQVLDPDMQLLLRLERLTDNGRPTVDLRTRRRHLDVAAQLGGGARLPGVTSRDIRIPADGSGISGRDAHGTEPEAATLPARLYEPDGLAPGSGLLVFHHGGGWVTGSLDSHEALCRYLAVRAGVRLLSVDYRLAPEHPFPAAVEDAVAAFRYARDHADELGADAGRIAVGGDSAGANLAAVSAYLTIRAGDAGPVFQLLFYPGCDAINRTRSRELFRAGFLLTEADIDWFLDHYLPPGIDRSDPRASILLADDLSGMPPTCLITAGFDPLRDEGELFATRLAAAGVPVAHRRHAELLHGFVNMIGLSARSRGAVAEAAAALRAAMRSPLGDPTPS